MFKYYKFLLPVLVFLAVVSYSLYLRNDIDNLSNGSGLSQSESNTVLKELPNLDLWTLDQQKISTKEFLKAKGPFYVHIWGTWCGPCESEFPELLNYAIKANDKGARFYLIAVNDEVGAIKKFIRRFKELPSNVEILIDQNNQVMDKFGTYKVPETFLFQADGENKNKYVGPQDWEKDIYFTQLSSITR